MATATTSASPAPQDDSSIFAKGAPSELVIPPLNVQAVIERVAGYVARNQASFEDRLRTKPPPGQNFAFLVTDDAYWPYYNWRKSEIKAGRGNAVSAGRDSGSDARAVGQQVAAADQGPRAPPGFRFSARMPTLNAQDYDVIKLTALFCARNGPGWQHQLAQKEVGNYQFDFLRPQHSLYQLFSRLQDQYKELLSPVGRDGTNNEAKRIAELERNIKNKFHILDRAKERAEYQKYQDRQKQAKEEEAEKEKIEYAQIDWHDFVIVETVVFTQEDDDEELPPPTSVADLQTASLEQRGAMSLAPASMRIEEAMPTADMMDMGQANGYQYPPAQQAYAQYPAGRPGMPPAHLPPRPSHLQPPPSHLPPPPSYLPPPPSHLSPPPPGSFGGGGQGFVPPPPVENDRTAARDASMDAQAAARAAASANAPMNIRKDYQPRSARAQKQAELLCPNCRQLIPADQMNEHMRIEMLDPRWREQRQKEQERQKTTNLSTADVAQNLKRLASQRTDVFDGTTGEMLSEEEKERRKRAAVSYDGVIPGHAAHGPTGRGTMGPASDRSGGGMPNAGHSTNLQEQLRHIQQKAQQQQQ